MTWSKVGLCAAALLAVAGAARATPLRLDYCIDTLGGGQYRYTFHLVLDNNDGSWQPGQGFGWIIFGDADGSQGPAMSPINDFVGDPSYFPIGPFTNYQGSGGGHNGPTLGPVVILMPPYPPNLWVPNGVGDSITWGGTASEYLDQGQMLWSNLFAGGGAGYANFEVGMLLPSCNGGPTGACCRPDGTCFIGTQANCSGLGGIYRGDGSDCATANCPQPPTGACCLPNLTCSIIAEVTCTARHGTYHGNNSTCATAGCPAAWQEQGDAGDLPATAQIPQGSGALPGIVGNLDAGDTDMYQIQICDPSSFSATTVGGASFDTMIWLFDSSGAGLTCDDDSQGTVQSTISSVNIPGPGTYYLALTGYLRQPEDSNAQPIWSSFGQDTRPDGPGAGNPVAEWDGSGGGGTYTIFLTGACYPGGGSTCYANCDHSTSIPFLNVNDFICFQGKFAAGDTYANCDMSTQPPVLNVNDFICFQGKFAAGCSAP